jgi:uncharacterized membrane protein
VNPNNDSDIQATGYGLSSMRIMTLADGVFAIVLTLLVLDIKAPEALSEAELITKLLALWPKLFSYIISFAILGIFWFGHHMEFHYIRRSDRIHIWLNLLFLVCIAFIPFSAALLGANLHNRVAIAIYGFNLIAAGLVRYVHWRYITYGHRLVDMNMDIRIIHKVERIFLLVPFAYLFAICLSFVSIPISLILYTLIPVLYIRPPREDRYLTSLPTQPMSRDDAEST